MEKRGKAGGRGHVSVSTRFPRAFSSDFDRFFSSLLNECVIDENNRSPPDSDFPLANIRRNRNKRTLRLTDKRVRLNSEWGISSLSSCIVVRSRVSSCLFEYLLSIGRSIPMIRQSRNREPGLQPFLFDSIYTYSGNGTTDDNW